MSQLHKLEKVLTFYQQQLEFIKARFQGQANTVAQLQHQSKQLRQELISTQERAAIAERTVIACQLTARLMQELDNKIHQNGAELGVESEKLQARRLELRQQMSKIEALEKVVANQTSALELAQRKIEQHLADERYLNTHFNGSTK